MLERYSKYGWRKSAICKRWGINAKALMALQKSPALRKCATRIALNAITKEEKAAVKSYALTHTDLNHREMTYRMIDEDVAFMSSSSVYRILKENNLLVMRKKKNKPSDWDPHQPLHRPDDIWQTDLMIIRYKGRDYFLLSYIDVYSRFITHHQLLTSMSGDSIKEATRKYLAGRSRWPLNIQSDNGSCYISSEYRSYLSKADIKHRLIHPYCPNENAEIERYHRTLRELIDPDDINNFDQLTRLVKEQIQYYNDTRYHSAIGFVTPYSKYTGKAESILKNREEKLIKARAARKKQNLATLQAKAA